MTRREYLEAGSVPVVGLLCCGSTLALQVSLHSYGGAWSLWAVGFLFLVLLAAVEFWHLRRTGAGPARWLGFSGLGAATIVVAALADDVAAGMAVSNGWTQLRPFFSAGILGLLFGTVQAIGLQGATPRRRLAWVGANALALASTGIALLSQGESMLDALAIAIGVLVPGGILVITLRRLGAARVDPRMVAP